MTTMSYRLAFWSLRLLGRLAADMDDPDFVDDCAAEFLHAAGFRVPRIIQPSTWDRRFYP